MTAKYVLEADGKTPKLAPDLKTWALWFENDDNRRVDYTAVSPDVNVSTVFLGIDHSWGDGAPVLWETMIFGGVHDQYEERYSTYDEAVAGHAKAVALATSSAHAKAEGK